MVQSKVLRAYAILSQLYVNTVKTLVSLLPRGGRRIQNIYLCENTNTKMICNKDKLSFTFISSFALGNVLK